jgi:hypothetical protein
MVDCSILRRQLERVCRFMDRSEIVWNALSVHLRVSGVAGGVADQNIR